MNIKGTKIPKQFLNALDFVNYDQYGKTPWTSKDLEQERVVLPHHYICVTPLLGIDCEMVGVGQLKDSALGRVSIVNEYGYCVYDTFVKPQENVTDYRTKYSGIRHEDLTNAPTMETIVKRVAKILKGKIIVGHSIQNDLKVLKPVNHPQSHVRDTAEYFKRALQTKGTPSLKDLAKIYLNLDIQTGEHSSIQDAQVTLKLYLLNRIKWEEDFATRREKANLKMDSSSATYITDISLMHVEPREEDLFVDSSTVFLRPNKIVGAYSSNEEYLDVQFRLLLEDFLRPLREGIKHENHWKLFNRSSLFHDVRIIKSADEFEVRGRATLMVPIERNKLQNVDWEESKLFLNGSLLLLTPDKFKNVKFAVILRYRPKKKNLEEDDENDENEENAPMEELAEPGFFKLNAIFFKEGPCLGYIYGCDLCMVVCAI